MDLGKGQGCWERKVMWKKYEVHIMINAPHEEITYLLFREIFYSESSYMLSFCRT